MWLSGGKSNLCEVLQEENQEDVREVNMWIRDAYERGIVNIDTGAYIYVDDFGPKRYYVGYTDTNKNDREIILFKSSKMIEAVKALEKIVIDIQMHGGNVLSYYEEGLDYDELERLNEIEEVYREQVESDKSTNN